MRKKSISLIIRVSITFILVIFVLYKVGLFSYEGRRLFLGVIAHVKIEFLLASLGIAFLINLSSSFKWFMLLRSRNIHVGLWRLYAYYTIGKFFNLLLPTSMGGDVIRMYQLGQYTGRKHSAIASVVVERFTGMVILLVIAVIAVILNINMFNEIWLTAALGAGSVILAMITWLILDERPFNFLQKLFGERILPLKKILAKIYKIRQAVLAYKNDSKALLWALVNSLIFQLLAVVNVWVSSLAFDSNLSFISMLVAVPVILFIMNLPISIGGIGLMEFAYTFTLALFGTSSSIALSTALLIRAKSILDAIIGGILYASVDTDRSIRVELTKDDNK